MLFIIITCLIIACIILILFIGKEMCNMAMKPAVVKEYSDLIFTPEQKEAMYKTNEEGIKWLEEHSNEVEIISKDGLKLKGYEMKTNKNCNIWVIAVHGYMGRGTDMIQYVKQFQKYGYNSLIIDLRAHGESEGEYIGMGWLDHYDLELWIDKIIEDNKNSKIILYGISMGAATVAMATGDELPKNVKLCIADCGYSSVWDEFSVHLRKIIHIYPSPLLYVGSIMSKMCIGYGFKEASTIKQVKKSITPTLFIHGKKDKFVPFYMLDKIYNNANCRKEKLEIDNAAHAESANANPEKYWKTVEKFIKENV